MPFPAPHLYLTIHGGCVNLGVREEWQVGLRIETPERLFPADQLQTHANNARDDVTIWWQGQGATNGLRTLYAPPTTCERVKLAYLGPDGLYVGDAKTAELPLGFRDGGVSGVPPMPAQLAVAVTLTTDSNRGLANKGRLYLPAPAGNALSDVGGILPAPLAVMADLTAGLIANLNNMPGVDSSTFPWTVSVMSNVRLGAVKPITGVRVGRRFDTQRRRAEKFPETPFVSLVSTG